MYFVSPPVPTSSVFFPPAFAFTCNLKICHQPTSTPRVKTDADRNTEPKRTTPWFTPIPRFKQHEDSNFVLPTPRPYSSTVVVHMGSARGACSWLSESPYRVHLRPIRQIYEYRSRDPTQVLLRQCICAWFLSCDWSRTWLTVLYRSDTCCLCTVGKQCLRKSGQWQRIRSCAGSREIQ